MAYRSVWKGFLKLALVTCPVILYRATAEADDLKLTQFNRQTGNRIEYQRIDSETGADVGKEDIANGVEVATGRYAEVTNEEIAGVAPRSALVLDIVELVPPAGIAWLFPDGHYYLGPDGMAAETAFAVLRAAVARSDLVAIGQLTLGRREHIVALTPGEKVFALSTLRYGAEVRSEEDCFPKLAGLAADPKLVASMQKLVAARARSAFDPARFGDRYRAALAELVRDKIGGKMVSAKPVRPPKLMDLEKAVARSVMALRGTRVA